MVHASSGPHRHVSQLQVQAQVQEREGKRRKVQEEKEESGVGFSVEQLEFNPSKPENAAKLEAYPDDYYHGLRIHCSNETRLDEMEHHAGEVAYTWYD